MKKYIVFISLLILLNGIAINANADDHAYLKTSVGLNYIPKQNISDNQLIGSLTLKQKFPVIGIAIGYETSDLWRIETAIDYYFLFTQAEKSILNDMNFNININTKISDLMVNIYKGFRLNDRSSVFIGGGLGFSSIQDEAMGYAKFDDETYQVLEPTSGKHIYRPAYKLSFGLDYKLRESIVTEISYNFFNLGSNKPRIINGNNNIIKHNFYNHNLMLGVRFAL